MSVGQLGPGPAWACALALVLTGACAPAGPDDSAVCANAPPVDWETFGEGFVTQNCQTCHASTSLNREDAPPDVHFDDAAAVWARKDRVLARAAAASPTMPPLGGTTADDRYLLEIWLTCGAEGE
ncbi:MAG: hypothetical protein EXR69_12305 [Myxococcales bacterium]|nr:hypothetical protein [Myxococcales bacterium]